MRTKNSCALRLEKNAVERDLWEQTLDEVKATYYKSGANFIFMSVPNAEALADEWLAKGYQVRRGQRENWLRVTFATCRRWCYYALCFERLYGTPIIAMYI